MTPEQLSPLIIPLTLILGFSVLLGQQAWFWLRHELQRHRAEWDKVFRCESHVFPDHKHQPCDLSCEMRVMELL